VAILYTIGHSTRGIDELMEALQAHSIRTLVDVRAFPMSRRLPHFNRENLEKSLHGAGIEYMWMKALGGYRKKIRQDSPNVGLRNQSFRNYADYMLTEEFQNAIGQLLAVAERSRTAYMCAERLYFRCHRRLVSDYLVAHGHEVFHIDDHGPLERHELTTETRMDHGQLIYGDARLF
jgi:uncharacterized protein (DUF488 family)